MNWRTLGPRSLFVVPVVAAVAVAGLTFFGPTGAGQSAPAATPEFGSRLFDAHCSACHGPVGEGIEGRGPDLRQEGEAAADFVLRTGRMPLANPSAQAIRGPVRFNEEEIVALVEHVGTLGDGPGIPDVNIEGADIGNGANLFLLNCAACHVASGAGAPIGGNRRAPALAQATPTEIGEAILVGPGAMPIFSTFTDTEINDIAAYIEDLNQQGTTDALAFGGAGPAAEGLAAWLLALVPLIALTRWIGHAKPGRNHPRDDTEPPPDDHPGDTPTTAEDAAAEASAPDDGTVEREEVTPG
ncbi:MAG: c-type cytochrome [Ilumatobacteraceae bacterium]|nr:c-type cytochrome [Ilumatobacteraceae bacterium]